ncbi:hypothetical protein [Keratinibaculum paraultunense]|nr:hypothetical protein [Keratinibaculum paraultunense]
MHFFRWATGAKAKGDRKDYGKLVNKFICTFCPRANCKFRAFFIITFDFVGRCKEKCYPALENHSHKELTMTAYYETNPDSHFYAYMQDKSVEQSLSTDEKTERKMEAINTLAIWGLENMEFTPDEQNYLIYAFINDLDSDVVLNKLLENRESQ